MEKLSTNGIEEHNFCYRIYHSPIFERFMLGVIVVAGLIVGLETSPTIEAQYGAWLHTIDNCSGCLCRRADIGNW
jgi:hypothetical protein